MNRKPNKVNQTITFLVFIFLCYEAFGLIKPSSGKFPEAEPVQLSNDNIVKHL